MDHLAIAIVWYFVGLSIMGHWMEWMHREFTYVFVKESDYRFCAILAIFGPINIVAYPTVAILRCFDKRLKGSGV